MDTWNSRSMVAVFLLTLLSMDAVFCGIVHVQHSRLPRADDKLLGASIPPSRTPARQARDLKTEPLSTVADVKSSESAPKLQDKATDSFGDITDNFLFDEDLIRAGKQKLKEEETAHEAMGAIAYVAGAAATFLTRPIINTMPLNFNKAIVGIAAVINSMGKNTTESQTHPTDNGTLSSLQARGFPSYNLDGVIPAWMKGENMDRIMDPSYEEQAPYASLRGPEAARLGVVDPILTVIGVIRRAIATEFLTTAVVMTVAHLARLFFVNLPNIIPIIGLSPRIDSQPALAPNSKSEDLPEALPEADASVRVPQDPVKRAELLAREVVAAVTRDQCAERAACLIGTHCSQYRFTPTIMRLLRSPEPTQDKPNHPVWVAFRDAAEGQISADECDRRFLC